MGKYRVNYDHNVTKSILYSHDSLIFWNCLNLNCYCIWLFCFLNCDCIVYWLFTACIGLVFEFCQLVFESRREGASFRQASEDFVAVNKWVSVGFLILFVILEYVESRFTWWVKAIWLLGQSNFSLFIVRITRDRFGFERTRVSSTDIRFRNGRICWRVAT